MTESGRVRPRPTTPRPRFVSIRTRLALTLALILAGITVLLCSLVSWQQALEHRLLLSRRLQQSAREFQARLESRREGVQSAARAVACIPTVIHALERRTLEQGQQGLLLSTLLQQASAHGLTEIVLLDPEGGLVASTLGPLAPGGLPPLPSGSARQEAQALLCPTPGEDHAGVEFVATAPVHGVHGFRGTVVAIDRLSDEDCESFQRASGDDVSVVTHLDKPRSGLVRAITSLRDARGARLQGTQVEAPLDPTGSTTTPLGDLPGQPGSALYVPLMVRSHAPFWLEVSSTPVPQSQTLLTVILGGLLFLLAGTVVGLVVARRLTGPLVALRRAADDLVAGRSESLALAVTSSDEVGALAQAFSEMVCHLHERDQELRARQLGLEQAQKVLEHINQELHKEKRELESLLDSIREGVLVLDSAGSIVKSNGALCTMFGVTAGDIVGRSPSQVLALVDDQDRAVTGLDALLRCPGSAPHAGTTLPWQGFLPRDDGTRLPVEVDSAPIKDVDHRSHGHVVTVQDVSRRFEMDRLKEEFLAFFTHDLKSPINAVVGYAQLLAESRLSDDDHEMVESMISLGKLLALEIGNILASTRLDAGRMTYHTEDFPVSTLLQELRLLFSPVARMQDVTLDVEDPASTGMLHADQEKVQDILNNLVGNALKFTPSGGTVRVTVRLVADMVVLVVQDTGRGIPSESLPRLFDKFYQVTGEGRGSGLGLYIARTLVEGMGGSIAVESVVREGTTFSLSLPRGSQDGIHALLHREA